MSNADQSGFRELLLDKLKALSEGPWEGRATKSEILRWLDNFTGQTAPKEEEQINALYLLSKFTFFGEREIRVLLSAVYRDLYRYPLLEAIRRTHHNSTDVGLISGLFKRELQATRFIGIGDAAESGNHLLYFFRQENQLMTNWCIHPEKIFKDRTPTGFPILRDPSVHHYVFIDDFCGSGTQAKEYSVDFVAAMKDAAKAAAIDITTSYYMLVATEDGINEVRRATLFDRVEAVFLLDDTFKAFSDVSRYYSSDVTEVSRSVGRAMAAHYGSRLVPSDPLGYKDGQLLLGFHHNIPDNTLPIIWTGAPPAWYPIFRRYPKYGS